VEKKQTLKQARGDRNKGEIMKKLFLTLALLLSLTQVASAVVLDTVWVNPLRFPTYTCFFAAFSPDTNKIVAALDSTIYYLDIRTGAIIDSFQKAPEIIDYGAVMSANGKRIAGVSGNFKCYVWDTTSKSIIKTFGSGSEDVKVPSVALSPDGKYAVCRVIERTGTPQYPVNTTKILVYNLDADSIVKWINLSYENEGIVYLAYSPDSSSFIVSSVHGQSSTERGVGTLTKYSTSSWQLETVLENNSDDYYSYLSYSSDGRYLAGAKTYYDDAGCYIWDMSDDTIFRSYTEPMTVSAFRHLDFSPDSKYLIFSGSSTTSGVHVVNFLDNIMEFLLFERYSHAFLSKDNNLMLVPAGYFILLLSLNWQPSSVFEPTEKNDDISIAQENKTLIVKSKDFDLRKIEIYDVMGSLVLSKTADSEEIAISMQFLQSGIYFVKVQTAKRVFVRKVLVFD
jgi:WD40 repeat protein